MGAYGKELSKLDVSLPPSSRRFLPLDIASLVIVRDQRIRIVSFLVLNLGSQSRRGRVSCTLGRKMKGKGDWEKRV